MPRFRLAINGHERDFDATRQGSRLHLAIGESAVDVHVTALDDGRFLLQFTDGDGFTHRVHLAGHRSGDRRQLWIDGRELIATRQRRQAAAGTADASLSATIPAVVSQILVSEGDEVAAGDKLVLLESMKMVIPIQAPAAGRVVKLNCAAGDSVPAGHQLVEIEPL